MTFSAKSGQKPSQNALHAAIVMNGIDDISKHLQFSNKMTAIKIYRELSCRSNFFEKS